VFQGSDGVTAVRPTAGAVLSVFAAVAGAGQGREVTSTMEVHGIIFILTAIASVLAAW